MKVLNSETNALSIETYHYIVTSSYLSFIIRIYTLISLATPV